MWHDARGVRDLSQLSRGEHVRTRHPVTHRWEMGRIVEQYQQPRSYQVESASGSVLRRNQRDIRETDEKHVFLSSDDDRQRNSREAAVMLWTIRQRDMELWTLLSNQVTRGASGASHVCNVSPYDCLLLNTSYVG